MTKEIIHSDHAPKAIGPYSQAVRVGNLLFTSGQLPINPATGEVSGDIAAQTRQVLENLKAVVEAAGGKPQTEKMDVPNVGKLRYYKDTEGNIFGNIQPTMPAK